MAELDRLDPKEKFEPIDVSPEAYEVDLDDLERFISLWEQAAEGAQKQRYRGCATLFALGLFLLSVFFVVAVYVLVGLGEMSLPSELLWGIVVLTVGQTATLVAVVFRWLFGGELAIPSFRDVSLPRSAGDSTS